MLPTTTTSLARSSGDMAWQVAKPVSAETPALISSPYVQLRELVNSIIWQIGTEETCYSGQHKIRKELAAVLRVLANEVESTSSIGAHLADKALRCETSGENKEANEAHNVIASAPSISAATENALVLVQGREDSCNLSGEFGTKPGTTEEKVERDSFFSKHAQRYVALEVTYDGRRFQGFARQENTDNTVEVVALNVRSNAKVNETNFPSEKEIDYVAVLNRALPNDIRVLGWSPVACDFHARFQAQHREYKYFFVHWGQLSITDMQRAASHFEGPHDFRNFCKANEPAVMNYNRVIYHAGIEPTDVHCGAGHVHAFRVRGSAFLYHQVRCMMAVLFMVGLGRAAPEIVRDMLDLAVTPIKPQYVMAAEAPLLLYSCKFNGLTFQRSAKAEQKCKEGFRAKLDKLLVASALEHAKLQRIDANEA